MVQNFLFAKVASNYHLVYNYSKYLKGGIYDNTIYKSKGNSRVHCGTGEGKDRKKR